MIGGNTLRVYFGVSSRRPRVGLKVLELAPSPFNTAKTTSYPTNKLSDRNRTMHQLDGVTSIKCKSDREIYHP